MTRLRPAGNRRRGSQMIYGEWLREKGEGLHHLDYDIGDMEEWIDY